MLNYKHLNYFYTVAKTGSIARAAEKLHLTPQTLSGQISLFEERLNVQFFKRAGRRLELTEAGRYALSYAEEIFQIGAELEANLRSNPSLNTTPFRVGIADAVPKSIAHRLLAPVLNLAEPVKLVCREDSLEHLLMDLAVHKLDMVLADRALPSNIDIKGYSHPLGECGVAFLATPELAASLEHEFPLCLNGAPLLLPSDESALRAPLLRWLERHDIHPRVVAEFDDGALMRAFGQAGAGVLPNLEINLSGDEDPVGLIRLGSTTEIKEHYFAISVEKHVSHPAVKAVLSAVNGSLFNVS